MKILFCNSFANQSRHQNKYSLHQIKIFTNNSRTLIIKRHLFSIILQIVCLYNSLKLKIKRSLEIDSFFTGIFLSFTYHFKSLSLSLSLSLSPSLTLSLPPSLLIRFQVTLVLCEYDSPFCLIRSPSLSPLPPLL